MSKWSMQGHFRRLNFNSFQWYKEHPNARCFDPCNRTLKFQESKRTPKSQFQECEFHPHTSLKVGLQHTHSFSLFISTLVPWPLPPPHTHTKSFCLFALIFALVLTHTHTLSFSFLFFGRSPCFHFLSLPLSRPTHTHFLFPFLPLFRSPPPPHTHN
jgi:hypothetical protein